MESYSIQGNGIAIKYYPYILLSGYGYGGFDSVTVNCLFRLE